MAVDDDEQSALDTFLSMPALDPAAQGEPPLRDGEDPLLTRERVSLDEDESADED